MSNIETVINIVESAYLYIPYDSEALRIDYVDREEGVFHTTGEESGDSITVEFDEVDLEKDIFYKLVIMENEAA